jgi:hypothetical protein
MTQFQLTLPDNISGEFESKTPHSENLPSPPPLLRQNCNREFYPPLEQQLTKIYKLETGKVYSFKENFSLHSRKRIENPVLITGTFVSFKNINIFEFIVDGNLIEVNYRNFSNWHNPTLFLVLGEELV